MDIAGLSSWIYRMYPEAAPCSLQILPLQPDYFYLQAGCPSTMIHTFPGHPGDEHYHDELLSLLRASLNLLRHDSI
jgi:hypothetical protein